MLPKKALRFWFVPASERRILLTAAVQLAFLGLAILGLVRRPDLASRLLLPGLVIAYTWGLYTLSYSCVRFSLVLMPWICLMGGWLWAEDASRASEPNSPEQPL